MSAENIPIDYVIALIGIFCGIFCAAILFWYA